MSARAEPPAPADERAPAPADERAPAPADETAYVLDEQVGYLLRLASQRHAAIFQRGAVHDLTPTQFSALVRLASIGECSQNELGRQTAVDAATIKGVVDRLRAKGMVRLRKDPDDRRRTLISLNEKFCDREELTRALHASGRAITRETLAPLTLAEQRALRRLLLKIA